MSTTLPAQPVPPPAARLWLRRIVYLTLVAMAWVFYVPLLLILGPGDES